MNQQSPGQVRRTLGRGGVLVTATLWLVVAASPPGHAGDGLLPGAGELVGDVVDGVVAPVAGTVEPVVPQPGGQVVPPVAQAVVQPVQQAVEPVVQPVAAAVQQAVPQAVQQPVPQAVQQPVPPSLPQAVPQAAVPPVKVAQPPVRQAEPAAAPAPGAPTAVPPPAAPQAAAPHDGSPQASAPDGPSGGGDAASPADRAEGADTGAVGRPAARRTAVTTRGPSSRDVAPRAMGGPALVRHVGTDEQPGADDGGTDLTALTNDLMRLYAGPTGIDAGLPGIAAAAARRAWLPFLLLAVLCGLWSVVLARRGAGPRRLTR